MKKYILILSLMIPGILWSQGTLRIESGAQMVIGGSSQLNITGNFINDGQFDAGTGKVIFSGSNVLGYASFGGSNFTSFYDVEINKSLGSMARLSNNVGVSNELKMSTGNLDLFGSDLDLTGFITGESETSRIIGPTGGVVIKFTTLTSPSNENPGNIGLTITSTQDLGDTWIIRGHTPMNINGSMTINRYFEVIPNTNSGLDATVRFNYFDGELVVGTHLENDFAQWHGSGGSWTAHTATASNQAANWVEVENINDFQFITLDNAPSASLPIELLTFEARLNDQQQVELIWITENEINNDFFTVERSKDAQTFETVTIVDGAGNSNGTLNYFTLDRNPFTGTSYYRLKQTDFDGTNSYSDIKAVHIDTDSGFSVFPNPFYDDVTILGQFSGKETVEIELFNNLGQSLYSQKISEQNEFRQTIDGLSELSPGYYFLVAKSGNSMEQFKLVKAD
ncbi:MAG: T9SS type A sorting domain-containing protein [Bacteroidota bacterium]